MDRLKVADMLEVDSIYKDYEGQPLLRGVSFRVQAGETVCLLGRSGSGKSTLLRIISGLEPADKGRVLWEGADLSGVPVHLRQFGLMFQDYALFPHRNVWENTAFGLRMQGLPPSEIGQRVTEALRLVNMQDFAKRRVTELSGGEQQRVALARTLAPRPRLIMLDEPLGALDRALRAQLLDELRRVLHETGIPAIYVTHDQEEAYAIADRLILLHDGQIEQSGTPDEIYRSPATVWAARFFGLGNLLEGAWISSDPPRVQTSIGVFQPACQPGAPVPGSRVTLLLRPTGARLTSESSGVNLVRGRVLDAVFRGEDYRVVVGIKDGMRLTFYLPQALEIGREVALEVASLEIACLAVEGSA